MESDYKEPGQLESGPGEPIETEAFDAEEKGASHEFLWLFEYGLEMDISVLNSPDRLDGLALLYGPAVLKGYQIMLRSGTGQGIASIGPSDERGAEVWGMLYRVPSRLAERVGDEPSLLDKIHLAGVFEPLRVVVREIYRNREVACVTYSATARQQFYPLPSALYVQRLLESARKQKLPDAYLQKLEAHSTNQVQLAASSSPIEQNTEPLPLINKENTLAPTSAVQRSLRSPHQDRWMMAFALYLLLLLLAVLALAVIQGLGFGSDIFTPNFTPLGVPWFVLVYGLLGGCVSSIVTLGRYRSITSPVLLTWFTRPFIGAIFALLAYLALNSGLFVLQGGAREHDTFFSLLGALAGLCEGWIFRGRTL